MEKNQDNHLSVDKMHGGNNRLFFSSGGCVKCLRGNNEGVYTQELVQKALHCVSDGVLWRGVVTSFSLICVVFAFFCPGSIQHGKGNSMRVAVVVVVTALVLLLCAPDAGLSEVST